MVLLHATNTNKPLPIEANIHLSAQIPQHTPLPVGLLLSKQIQHPETGLVCVVPCTCRPLSLSAGSQTSPPRLTKLLPLGGDMLKTRAAHHRENHHHRNHHNHHVSRRSVRFIQLTSI